VNVGDEERVGVLDGGVSFLCAQMGLPPLQAEGRLGGGDSPGFREASTPGSPCGGAPLALWMSGGDQDEHGKPSSLA